MNNGINGYRRELSDAEVAFEGSGRFLFTDRAAPACAPEVPPRPVCSDAPRCEGCPYCGHGFVCRGRDGSCMRMEAARINHYEIEEEPEHADTGNAEERA